MKKHLWILTAAFVFLVAAIAFGQAAPFGDSPKAGADYRVYETRLPTVKLTDAEQLNLITTIHEILDSGQIRRADVDAAMLQVFGEERAAEYLALFDAREGRGQRWSRRENVAMIAAMYPHVPGDTEEEKAEWLIARAAPCFLPERWDNEIFPYVLERVQEYKAAGGTLERWPEVVVVEPDPEADLPADLPESVTWLHHDISAWPVTASLEASIEPALIRLSYDKARAWPVAKTKASDGGDLVGNCWVLIEQDGQWYAVAWDWMRHGQTAKPRSSLRGSDNHMPGALSSFSPQSGARYGFVVSTPARGQERTSNERSNVSWVTWP